MNWSLPTRPTVRGLPVVCSSPHAEGRRNRRAARCSGSSWRVAGEGHRPRGTGRPRVRTMRRYGARSTVSHLVSLEPELVFGDVGPVTLVTPPGQPSDRSGEVTGGRWRRIVLGDVLKLLKPPYPLRLDR